MLLIERKRTFPAYTLINAEPAAIYSGREKPCFSVYLSVNNLTDKAYQNHLSRLKYGAVNNYTSHTGVFNMGREFVV